MLPIIYEALKDDYLKFTSNNDFVKISEEFMKKKTFLKLLRSDRWKACANS